MLTKKTIECTYYAGGCCQTKVIDLKLVEMIKCVKTTTLEM